MASSNKAHDPAAAALLAIEEALNLHAAGEGAEPGEAPANPIGAASADKTKGRVPGDRETAAPHPETSRRARDSVRTPEPSLTTINEDRLLAAARANSAQVEERPVPEQSGVTAPSIRPANDGLFGIVGYPVARLFYRQPRGPFRSFARGFVASGHTRFYDYRRSRYLLFGDCGAASPGSGDAASRPFDD